MTEMSSPKQAIQAWASKQLEAVKEAAESMGENLNESHWEAKLTQLGQMEHQAMREALDLTNDFIEAHLSYRNNLRIRLFVMDTENKSMAVNVPEDYISYYKANRMNIIVQRAIWAAIVERIDIHNIGWTQEELYCYLSVSDYNSYIALLELMSNIQVTSAHLTSQLNWYNKFINELISRDERQNKQNAGDKGLAAKINANREKEVNAELIEEQIQKWQSEIGNILVARTWGWEVEAPNPGEDTVVPAGVEKGSDGSVESYESDHSDCDCSCSDCRYHECDCDDCDQQNDDPQHCGYDDCVSCASYEFRTTGGIPRALHPGLKKLLEQIADTEKNESAGTHIHVYARDLEAYQIGIVLGAYALTQRVWDVISGRDVDNDQRCRQYASLIPGESVSYTLRKKVLMPVGKFNAVNTLHVTTDRGTLEFRQMNCNFDYNRITFMAWMVRGLVEVAKRGATITEFFNITDVEGFIKLYAKYGFTTFQETEVIDDPMGSRYNQSRNRIAIA